MVTGILGRGPPATASQAMHLEKVRLVFGDSRVIAVLFLRVLWVSDHLVKCAQKVPKRSFPFIYPPDNLTENQAFWKRNIIDSKASDFGASKC